MGQIVFKWFDLWIIIIFQMEIRMGTSWALRKRIRRKSSNIKNNGTGNRKRNNTCNETYNKPVRAESAHIKKDGKVECVICMESKIGQLQIMDMVWVLCCYTKEYRHKVGKRKMAYFRNPREWNLNVLQGNKDDVQSKVETQDAEPLEALYG